MNIKNFLGSPTYRKIFWVIVVLFFVGCVITNFLIGDISVVEKETPNRDRIIYTTQLWVNHHSYLLHPMMNEEEITDVIGKPKSVINEYVHNVKRQRWLYDFDNDGKIDNTLFIDNGFLTMVR